jgi:hypothetical protein
MPTAAAGERREERWLRGDPAAYGSNWLLIN